MTTDLTMLNVEDRFNQARSLFDAAFLSAQGLSIKTEASALSTLLDSATEELKEAISDLGELREARKRAAPEPEGETQDGTADIGRDSYLAMEPDIMRAAAQARLLYRAFKDYSEESNGPGVILSEDDVDSLREAIGQLLELTAKSKQRYCDDAKRYCQ